MKKHAFALAAALALSACGGGVDVPEKVVIGIKPPPVRDFPKPPFTPEPPEVITQPPVTPVPPPEETAPPPVIDEEEDEEPVSIPENPDFSAKLARAPADGSYVCSESIIYLTGQGIRNAELVHGDSYSTYARFSTSVGGTFAVLQFNPRQIWNNGAIKVRVLAWDQPAGTGTAREVEVMPERTWYIANDAEPCTPPSPGSITPQE